MSAKQLCFLSAVALLLLFCFPQRSAAYVDEWRRHAEMLPQYCQDRVDWSKPGSNWSKWKPYFGSVGIHMSHYCNGLYSDLMAMTAPNKRERDKRLRMVVSEMTYVSNGCDEKCVLYADVHRRLGNALMLLGRTQEAVEHLQIAERARATSGTPSAKP